MWKWNMYYRPDMGWEPVWHGLWINKVELTQKISWHNSDLKVLLSSNYQYLFLHDDKNETEPVWLSPVFAIFQAPHVRLYA